MTKYIPPVRRKEAVAFGKPYHYYVDGDNNRIPGVTTILGGGIPKPNLITWAANATAEGAVNDWDTLAQMPPAARLKALQEIRYETSNKAKNKGTLIHGYAEKLVSGEQVTGIPDELRPYTEAYVRFIDTWNVDPILVEVVIVNYTHGYAGTLDLVAELTLPSGQREVWLLDIKTGEKGVFSETALQLAAYRNAEFYVDDTGSEAPMIKVAHTAAIHVTADDAVLIPTASEYDYDGNIRRVYDDFRFAKRIYELDSVGLIGAPMSQPTRSTARIVWDMDDE